MRGVGLEQATINSSFGLHDNMELSQVASAAQSETDFLPS